MNYLKPFDPAYCVEEERNCRRYTKYYEGVFAQGSGYLQIRGSYEEGLACADQGELYMRMPANVTIEKPRHPYSKWGVYVPGVTGIHPMLKEELVNLPYLLKLDVTADGEKLDMELPGIHNYRRCLDFRDGVLYRDFDWRTESGLVRCQYRRFLPRQLKRVVVQEFSFQVASGRCRLTIENGIDCKVTTNGYNHFKKVEESGEAGRRGCVVQTDNGDSIRMLSMLFDSQGKVLGPVVDSVLREGETLKLTKLSAVSTSRDLDAGYLEFDQMEALLAETINSGERVYLENKAQWARLWKRTGVSIVGDETAQKAVNFSIYHLLRSVNPDDSRVAVCAKGYSGEAYFGHFFWDTEVYLLPFYLYTNPELAKKLVEFRIQTLPGAMANAKAYGYPGARYPWESSVSGEEQCPNWQYADHEIHVTADVVHGIWHYYQAAGDMEFLKNALPVLKETARYWLARVCRRPGGAVTLDGVMGPDEYICLCNNNAYTNFMAARSLEITAWALELCGEAAEPGFIEDLRETAQGLMNSVDWSGVIPQCDHFEDYEEPDFETMWPDRSKPFGGQVSQEYNYRVKALKQADVLMLPYLFPERFSAEQIRQSYDFYYPYTTHDSSLSAIIHSILCVRFERDREAWELFQRALEIDLSEAKMGAAEGVHIANCGGIWQGVILGFAGMKWEYDCDQPTFHPRLPKHWKSLSFSVCMKGEFYRVSICGDQAHVIKVE